MTTSAIQDKAREAYKLLKKNYRADGLRIDLSATLSGDSVCLPVTFVNMSDTAMKLVFGNASGEFEQGQMIVMDARGERVTAKHRLRIDNREDDLTVIEIGSQSQWTYTIQGTLSDGTLSLRGIVYDLNPGDEYRVQYRYPYDRTQEHNSNVAVLQVPLVNAIEADTIAVAASA